MKNQLMNPEILSSLILNGDISKLSPVQRVEYVAKLCERLGIDPLTQPFKILRLSGKEVLYADKGCAQQLCKVYKISTEITKKERIEDVYAVTVRATDNNGRYTDEDGIVTIGSAKGDALANSLMKAVTKAKRRAVLAFCGLGMLDETEIETIKGVTTEDIITEPLKLPTPKNVSTDAQKQAEPMLSAPIVQKDPHISKEKPNIKQEKQDQKIEDAVNTFKGKIVDFITVDQETEIKKLAQARGFSKKGFMDFLSYYFDIHSISEIPANAFEHIVKKMNSAKEAK